MTLPEPMSSRIFSARVFPPLSPFVNVFINPTLRDIVEVLRVMILQLFTVVHFVEVRREPSTFPRAPFRFQSESSPVPFGWRTYVALERGLPVLAALGGKK